MFVVFLENHSLGVVIFATARTCNSSLVSSTLPTVGFRIKQASLPPPLPPEQIC